MNKIKKSKFVVFRLTPNDKINLKVAAAKRGISISEFLRNSFVL